MPTAYEIAKQPDGRHHGLLRQLDAMGERQRRKSAQSYQEQIALHLDKIAFPGKYVSRWPQLRESHRVSLLREWRKEVTDREEQLEVLKEYEDENP